MSSKFSFKNGIVSTLVFVLLISLFFIWGFFSFNENSGEYLPEVLARWNPELFTNDFSVQSRSNGYVPQLAVDSLIHFFKLLTGRLEIATVVCYILSCSILCTAIVFFATKIPTRNRFMQVLVAVFFLTCVIYFQLGTQLGSNNTWGNKFYHATLATAIGFWCVNLVFSHKRNYFAAFTMAALAIVFHIHVGFHVAVLLSVVLVVDIISESIHPKMILTIIPSIITLAIIYSLYTASHPSLLTGQEFIEAYAKLRVPHHLRPSSMNPIFNLTCLTVFTHGLLLCLYSLRSEDQKETQIIFSTCRRTVALWLTLVILLLINHVAIDILPIGFIVKVMPLRFTPVFRIWLAFVATLTFFYTVQAKKYSFGIVLLGTIFLSNVNQFQLLSGLILCVSGYIIMGRKENCFSFYRTVFFNHFLNFLSWFIAIAVTICSYYYRHDLLAMTIAISLSLLFLTMHFSIGIGKILLSMILGAYLTFSIIYKYTINDIDRTFPYMHIKALKNFNQAFPYILVDNQLYELALEFKEATSPDVTYHSNPLDSNATTFFRLYSERSVVLSHKAAPQSDKALIEWINRFSIFGNLKKKGNGYIWTQHSKEAKLNTDFALKYGAEYILITIDLLDDYLKYGNNRVFLKNDKFAIIKLVE